MVPVFWMDQGIIQGPKPNPEKEPYCIVIPPPNVNRHFTYGPYAQ